MVCVQSPASMASTIRCLEHRLGISHRVVRFALPLATDLNTDGNALYEVMAAIFVSQLNDIHLDLSQLVTLGLVLSLLFSLSIKINNGSNMTYSYAHKFAYPGRMITQQNLFYSELVTGQGHLLSHNCV